MSQHETPEAAILQFHEGSIDLPGGYEDRTSNILVPKNVEAQPNLSIARDNLKPDELLADYVTRQVALLKSRLPGHKVLDRTPAQLGSDDDTLAGECITAQYKNNGRLIYQRQAAFLISADRALIFSASSPAPLDDAFDEFWQHWLSSFTPRSED